jgi:hypothetical protein
LGTEDQPVINASELGEFAYCRCAWWLGRVRGLPSTRPETLARGQALHEGHGRRAQRAVRLGRIAAWALPLSAALIGIGILLMAGGGSL